jgi:peptidyl-prolyl cis-trans isomerase SurA
MKKGEGQVTAQRMGQGRGKARAGLTAKDRAGQRGTALGRRARTALCAALLAGLGLAAPLPGTTPSAAAQEPSPFAPVMRINDSVITAYELDQRMRFLTLLRIPGDPEQNALKGLLTDRLAAEQARRVGIRLTAEQVEAGMQEFAARANLTTEQFLEALAQGGVDAATFRDFAANGLLWREMVRGRFGPTVSISEAEVDRAIAGSTKSDALQLLLSEIIIPVDGDPEDELALAASLRRDISGEGAFADAARRLSAAPSAPRGGQLDWLSASGLPPQIVQLVLGTGPGQVSQPVLLDGAVAVFQLRNIAADGTAEAPAVAVEYAQFLLPNTQDVLAQAEALHNRIDSCRDLWAEARGLPEDRLTITRAAPGEMPADIAQQLATLDPGEYSAALTRGASRVFLMLCAREPVGEEGARVDRAAVRRQLESRELELMAEGWLEELRSEAIIQTP